MNIEHRSCVHRIDLIKELYNPSQSDEVPCSFHYLI
jgi:hypothetical protein